MTARRNIMMGRSFRGARMHGAGLRRPAAAGRAMTPLRCAGTGGTGLGMLGGVLVMALLLPDSGQAQADPGQADQVQPDQAPMATPAGTAVDAVDDRLGGMAMDTVAEARAIGYLPVTALGAIPDDDGDDTAALQAAIDQAFRERLVVYLPGGRYRVSDTLRLRQPTTWDAARQRAVHDRRHAHRLVGAGHGRRAVLELLPNAAGFDNPAQPKPVLQLWAQSRASARDPALGETHAQANIHFNQVVRGLDIDLRGVGHRGAVGVQHAGSQGSMLIDVAIQAQGAFAGVLNPPGQGGGTYGLRVEGGQYGIWADHRARYPLLAGVVLRDQQTAALHWHGQSNLTLVGFQLTRRQPGPLLTLRPGDKAFQRTLTLVDGELAGRSGAAIANPAGRNLVLHGVTLDGFDAWVTPQPAPAAGAAADAARPVITADRGAVQCQVGRDSLALIDGVLLRAGEACPAPPPALAPAMQPLPAASRMPDPAHPFGHPAVARHWQPARWPQFDDPAVLDVRLFGAQPDDGQADDDGLRAALQAAARTQRPVLLPKGVFELRAPLRLGADSVLLGVAKQLSVLRAAADWQGAPGAALVETVNDPGATTTLASLLLERPAARPDIPLLRWRAGRDSLVTDLTAGVQGRGGTAPAIAGGSVFRIEQGGGGRWYGLHAEWNRMSPGTAGADYRLLQVTGTREPLVFYAPNLERGRSDPQAEIRDAADVTLFYLKAETLPGRTGSQSVLRISGAEDIALYGYSGNAEPQGRPLITVQDSRRVLLANLMPVRPDRAFNTLEIAANGAEPGMTARRLDGTRPLTLGWISDTTPATPTEERP